VAAETLVNKVCNAFYCLRAFVHRASPPPLRSKKVLLSVRHEISNEHNLVLRTFSRGKIEGKFLEI